jgi:hypothetical protein
MADTPPDWVLIEAAKRCGWSANDIPALRDYYSRREDEDDGYAPLCDMIQKYEQPPVDRKLLCVEEAMCEFGWDEDWMGRGACYRAIELWEEGFGK